MRGSRVFSYPVTYDIDETTDHHEVDDDSTCCNEDLSSGSLSLWSRTVQAIEKSLTDPLAIIYLDFVRDAEQIVGILQTDKVKAAKYTGQMTLEDRTLAETKFSKGDIPVLVATESFELGVDNPKVKQVIWIGTPRNLGVLLQEFGRAGRKAGTVAKRDLYFNEHVDDKRLGLWLRSSFDSRTNDDAHEAVKLEVLSINLHKNLAICVFCLPWKMPGMDIILLLWRSRRCRTTNLFCIQQSSVHDL